MKISRPIIFLIILLLNTLAAVADDSGGKPNREWKNVKTGGKRWGLVAGWDTNDASGYVYRLGFYPFPYLRGSFYKSLDANNITGSSLFSLALGIVKIVEFNSTISISQSTSLVDFTNKTLNWSPIVNSNVTVTGVDGTVVTVRRAFTSFSAPVAYPGFSANLTIDYYPQNITTVADDGFTRVRSFGSQIKYSFGISGFSYQYANSSLAFVHVMWSAKSRAYRSSSSSSTSSSRAYLGVGDGGYLAWLGSVRAAPGVSLSVQTQALQSTSSVGIADDSSSGRSSSGMRRRQREDGGPNSNSTNAAGRNGNDNSASDTSGRGSDDANGGREAEGDLSRDGSETGDAVVFVVDLKNTRPAWLYWDPTIGLQNPSAASQVDPSTVYSTTVAPTSGERKVITSGLASIFAPGFVVLLVKFLL